MLLYADELEHAKEDLRKIQEHYESLKRFLQINKDIPLVRWDALKAYNFGHIEPYLFRDHDYVCRERSLEQVLEDMSAHVVSEDDDSAADCGEKEYTEIWEVSPELSRDPMNDADYVTECRLLENAYTEIEIKIESPYSVYVKPRVQGMAPGTYVRNHASGDYQILGHSVTVPTELQILSDAAWEKYSNTKRHCQE